MSEDTEVKTEISTEEGSPKESDQEGKVIEPETSEGKEKEAEAGKEEKKPSVLERIEAQQKKADEGEEKPSEDKKPSEDTGQKAKKRKPEAEERIRGLTTDKKELKEALEKSEATNTELKEQITALQTRNKEIQEKLATGKITEEKATKEAEDAVADVKNWMKNIELPEDLEPFKDSFLEMVTQGIEIHTAPLKKQIKDLQDQREKEKKEKEERERAEDEKRNLERYYKMIKVYPHLFEKPEKEGEPAELKPVFDKEAVKFAQFVDVRTDEGIQLLFEHLNRFKDKAEKAELEREKQERIKKGGAERPAENISAKTTKPSVLDIVREKQKQIGG